MITRVLGTLLIAQLALVVFLYWPRDIAPTTSEALIADMPAADILGIEITEGSPSADRAAEAAPLRLSRNADSRDWRLASGLPADVSKIDTLLDALLEQNPGYAIATSDGGALRFAVDKSNFVRRIVLRSAAGERTAYLGSSPSFRKVHARRGDDSAVYQLELNSYDAPVNEDNWLDKKLLAMRDLSTIVLYGTEFTRDKASWRRSDGQGTDAQRIETLAQALSKLQVTGSVSPDNADLAGAGEALRVTVADSSGRTQLTVLDNPDSETYYLRSDAYTEVFATSSYDAERLIEAAKAAVGLDTDPDKVDQAVDDGADIENPDGATPDLESLPQPGN